MRTCSSCRKTEPDISFAKPGSGFYKQCGGCRERQRCWRASESGKSSTTRSRAKYRAGKGKAVEQQWQQRYNASAQGKTSRKKYRRSKRGKTTTARAKTRYILHHKARNAINNGLQYGKIHKPSSCAICGQAVRLHAHHYLGWDKEHQLDVWWVCDFCDPPFNSALPHGGSLTLKQARKLLTPILGD